MLGSSVDVAYKLALKIINKPYKQKFEYPLYPGTDLAEENVEYKCHHSVKDGITEVQIDALKAIHAKL